MSIILLVRAVTSLPRFKVGRTWPRDEQHQGPRGAGAFGMGAAVVPREVQPTTLTRHLFQEGLLITPLGTPNLVYRRIYLISMKSAFLNPGCTAVSSGKLLTKNLTLRFWLNWPAVGLGYLFEVSQVILLAARAEELCGEWVNWQVILAKQYKNSNVETKYLETKYWWSSIAKREKTKHAGKEEW